MRTESEVNELISPTEWRDWSNPIVSIVCTTFNQKDFIKDTLEGFLIQQTSFPFEIIVHDDASTDGTTEIIKEYENRYPIIIKTIYQTENQYSKKVDISNFFLYPKINGKYIALCEGDDYWTDPLKLQKQVDFLENNKDYGLVFTDIDRITENGNIIDKNYLKNDPYKSCESFEDYLISAPFRAPCTWVFRKNLYKERNNRFIVGDFPMLLDILANSKIHRLDDNTANYRVLNNSASHFTDLSKLYLFKKGIFEIQMDYANIYNVSANIIDIIQTKFAWTSYYYAVASNDKEQVIAANKLLIGHPELSYKFKVVKLLSKIKLGRRLVRRRLIKQLGYTR